MGAFEDWGIVSIFGGVQDDADNYPAWPLGHEDVDDHPTFSGPLSNQNRVRRGVLVVMGGGRGCGWAEGTGLGVVSDGGSWTTAALIQARSSHPAPCQHAISVSQSILRRPSPLVLVLVRRWWWWGEH